jgi:hypothetical protein
MHPYANEIFDFYKKVAWGVRGLAMELREGQRASLRDQRAS